MASNSTETVGENKDTKFFDATIQEDMKFQLKNKDEEPDNTEDNTEDHIDIKVNTLY